MAKRHDQLEAPPPDDNRCTDTKGASELLALSQVTLAQWRMRGKGPIFHRFGRQIRYQVADLVKYMAACRIGGAK